MKLPTKNGHLSRANPSTQGSFRLVLQRFALVFFPVAAIFIGGTVLLYQTVVDTTLKEIRNSENHAIDVGIGVGLRSISSELQSITHDLAIMVSENGFIDLVTLESQAEFTHIQSEWTAFSQIKRIYDQIRWIDLNGQERIRINFNNGNPTVVPEDQLQNKRHRYYFNETLSLNRGGSS